MKYILLTLVLCVVSCVAQAGASGEAYPPPPKPGDGYPAPPKSNGDRGCGNAGCQYPLPKKPGGVGPFPLPSPQSLLDITIRDVYLFPIRFVKNMISDVVWVWNTTVEFGLTLSNEVLSAFSDTNCSENKDCNESNNCCSN